jgi:acyl transferase domain-containing protein/acyl carrier protein/Zn-dependent alcohol dehydrogenase
MGPVEPIAIVGAACRFPEAETLESFWRLLKDGIDAIREAPVERFDAELYAGEDLEPGRMSSRSGAFLKQIDRFDRRFFGLSLGEAAWMEPQQRLLLEVAWEALEHMGVPPSKLAKSATGVFVGCTQNDTYGSEGTREQSAQDRWAHLTAYSVAGSALCMAVNRISHQLDLLGPSLSIDTGCSSALVAVHQACQSLRIGESTLAIAGGVNIILSPRGNVALSQAWMLANDGRSKSFDARADGYGRGEGCGLVVLERLSDAVQNGHRVLAMIRGSRINHDGKSEAFMAPSAVAQEAAIRGALAEAMLSPSDVQVIEAHGVGSPKADIAEAKALSAVFGGSRRAKPLLVGSVKGNLGHLEQAAGIASLIKAVLSLRHGEVPRQLHFRSLHPEIERNGFPFEIPSRTTAWPEGPTRAVGLSSFGLGGVNAHVVVTSSGQDRTAASPRRASSVADRPVEILPISARTEPALRSLAAAYADRLGAIEDLRGACTLAATGREHFEARAAFVGDAPALREQLLLFARGIDGKAKDELRPAHLAQLADAFVKGKNVRFEEVYDSSERPDVDLPSYPFERERLWIGKGAEADERAGYALTLEERGVLDGFEIKTETRSRPGAGEVEIEVRAAALNFRDVLAALGEIEVNAIGLECAGLVSAVGEGVNGLAIGDKVVAALTDRGSLRSHLVTRADLVVKPPSNLRLEEAAAAPIAYLTARYALEQLCPVSKGTRILIHSATGGVGLAALQIARRAGAIVLATAGTEDKRALLLRLGVERAMSSRTLDFADEILAATGGAGVDVVLNSISGPAIAKSFSVLKKGGCFLEMGKREIWDARRAKETRPDVRYVPFDLGDLSRDKLRAMLLELMGELGDRLLEPPVVSLMPLEDCVSAFRRLAGAKHVGKIVLSLPESKTPNLPKSQKARPHDADAHRTAERITELAARVLDLPSSDDGGPTIDIRRPLQELGLTSLRAVELRNAIMRELGVPIPATSLFDYPTIQRIAELVDGKVARPRERRSNKERSITSDETIAIVGTSCRLPGGVVDRGSLWRLLRDGTDAIREVPSERFRVDDYFDPNPDAPGKMYARWGGFIEGVELFDAEFFGIAPREAACMDPQQRLLLELSWQALEDASVKVDALEGSATGVFMGISSSDYARRHFSSSDPARIDAHSATGSQYSAAIGRISYALGLQGPNMAIDTACSSSLVAVHLACQSLIRGECDLALAGGVSLILAPEPMVALSRARMLSPTGRSRTFDDGADGYVRGEGCGIVVLKRLSAAKEAGDRVLALIRATAINQDGRSGGLTAPNGPAQTALIRTALDRAGLEPRDISYVEAHGTGTPLGDPIEVQALAEALGDRPGTQPVRIGSIKSNIGHLEAAAGIAGLLKVIVSLEHQEIPRTLHVREPSSKVAWSQLKVSIAREPSAWPEAAVPRRAGVSSFGFSGTNAHAIIEEFRRPVPIPGNSAADHTNLPVLALSARSTDALRALSASYASRLRDDPSGAQNEAAPALDDLLRTSSVHRAHHPHRLAIARPTRSAIAEALEAFSAGNILPGVSSGAVRPGRAPRLAFVFSGQGSQWAGMGRELFREEPDFRAVLERCDRLFGALGDPSLIEEIHRDDASSRLADTAIAQPAIFALQMGLAALFERWGVLPHAIIGHSVGEIAAAAASGALTIEDAVEVIHHRGRVMAPSVGLGKMISVALPFEEARNAIAGLEDRVSVAAINSPFTTVLSGENEAIDGVAKALEGRGVRVQALRVRYAFHSPQMEPFREALTSSLSRLVPTAPSVAVISTVTGRKMTVERFDAPYWWSNIRSPVRFKEAIAAAMEEGVTAFLEIGPHPVLMESVLEQLDTVDARVSVTPTLRRAKPERASVAASIASLYVQGFDIEWTRVHPRGGRADLPSYPFVRKRHWIESPELGVPASGARRAGVLGKRTSSAKGGVIFETDLSISATPYLEDHKVHDQIVVPGSAHLSLALEAAIAVFGHGPHAVERATFVQPIVLEPTDSLVLQLVVEPISANDASFQIFSRPRGEADSWTLHAHGVLRIAPERALPDLDTRAVETPKLELTRTAFYGSLDARGLGLGPRFRWVTGASGDQKEALVRLETPAEATDSGAHALYPGLLDSCFQALSACLDPQAATPSAYVPVGIERLRLVDRPGGVMWCRARVRGADRSFASRPATEEPETFTADLVVSGDDGRCIAELKGLEMKRAPIAAIRGAGDHSRGLLHRIAWRKAPLVPSEKNPPSAWLVVSDKGGAGQEIAARIESAGDRAVVVEPSALGGVGESFSAPPAGVIHLVALDASIVEASSGEDATRCERIGVESALDLIQRLDALGWSSSTRVFIVTRGCQAVGRGASEDRGSSRSRKPPTVAPLEGAGESHGASAFGGASMTGLAAVARNEYPGLALMCVDLDPDRADLDDVVAELRSNAREDLVALRGGERFVARLERISPRASPRSLEIRSDATYLITGGLGGLGIEVARRFVERGAKSLVLAGRREPSEGGKAAIAGLEALGAEVMIEQADVAARSDVERVIAKIRAGHRPLAGIVHAAGVIDDGLIRNQTPARAAAVLAPKVAGAWNLHIASRDLPLDFFVLFSSIASLLGFEGQAAYASANAFLDALAWRRRAHGLTALSIGFGPWAEVGMASRLAESQRLGFKARGVSLLRVEEALSAFEHALALDHAHVAVARIDWPALARGLGASGGPSLLEGLARPSGPSREVGIPLASAQSEAPRTEIHDRLDRAKPGEREAVLRAALVEKARAVLGFGPSSEVDVDRPLQEIGLDSLMAVELRDGVSQMIGHSLPVTLLFNHPTIASLALYLSKELGPPIAARPRAALAVESAEARAEDSIAIIGMACRYPGGVDDPEKMWRMLADGRDGIIEVPTSRWDARDYYDPDPNTPGKMYTRWGGFIGDVASFDAELFGISPREAASMDPQQRLLLEVSWEALERAGQRLDRLAGTETGVFVGISTHDYATRLIGQGAEGMDRIDPYYGTGNTLSVASGRISYVFGLQGPSVAIDTACSSSLVAIHLACRSLRDSECELALAGGVNLMLSPENTVYFCKLRALADDGRCKTFDAKANGYSRGEGCGIVVLKRLSKAIADGDEILAIIRGSAVNQDGRSAGLTAPNGIAQENVIKRALKEARIQPSEVAYVEAHGTGTSLGDPIEIQALASALERKKGAPELWVGSVKTNIGHLETAAGVAGLMKVVLSLQHGAIPPSLNFNEPSPHIPWDEIAIRVPTTLSEWPSHAERRIAGLSSFGFSGTNVHLVIEAGPSKPPRAVAGERAHALVLSAKSDAALSRLAARTADHLDGEQAPIADVAHTSTQRRTPHLHRAVAVGRSNKEVAAALRSFVRREASPSWAAARCLDRAKIAFVYSGQGSQYVGMGSALASAYPVFREALERAERALSKNVSWSLLGELSRSAQDTRLDRTEIAQPAIVAIELALTALWRSFGVEPSAVIGHSVGEIAAASVAGVFDLEEALELAVHRGRAMESSRGLGKMLSVGVSAHEISKILAAEGEDLAIAAINAPTSTVLSGESARIDRLAAALVRRGIAFEPLRVEYAFHSAQVDGQALERALSSIVWREPSLPIVSTVTGAPIEQGPLDAQYWRRNACDPVRFADGIQALVAAGTTLFLEVSAHPVLGRSIDECISHFGAEAYTVASLRRNRDEEVTLLSNVGALFAHGAPVDWTSIEPGPAELVPLPTYPFERNRYWPKNEGGPKRARVGMHSDKGSVSSSNPFRGELRRGASPRETSYEAQLGDEARELIQQHRVFGEAIVPAAVFMEMALAVAPGAAFEDFAIHAPLALEEGSAVSLETIVVRAEGAETVEIYGRDESRTAAPAFVLHASAKLTDRADSVDKPNGKTQSRDLSSALSEIDGDAFYTALRRNGMDLGPRFRIVSRLWRSDQTVLGELSLAPGLAEEGARYVVHPAILDGALQLFAAELVVENGDPELYLPIGATSVRWYGRPTGKVTIHLTRRPTTTSETIAGDLVVFDEGMVIGELEGLVFKRAPKEALLRSARRTAIEILERAFRVSAPRALEAGALRGAHTLIVGLGGTMSARLADGIVALGGRATIVDVGLSSAEDEIVRAIEGAKEAGLLRVAHVASLDESLANGSSSSSAAARIIQSALTVAKRLARARQAPAARLWFFTRGSQSGAPDPAAIAGAALWGLASVLGVEHPALSPVCADLDETSHEGAVDAIIGELSGLDREPEIVLAHGERRVARIIRSAPVGDDARRIAIDPEGSYFISGGLGGLGLEIARWLADRGARHLVLGGRSGPRHQANERLQRLGERAVVEIAAVDVSEPEEVERTLARIRSGRRRLKGVVHAAGTMATAPITEMTWESFWSVIRPKISGAMNLDAATRDDRLDFFLALSSIAPWIGSPQLAGYAAANAGLDAIVRARRARGEAAFSVQLGPVGEVGMSAGMEQDRIERWDSLGIGLLAPSDALAVMEKIGAFNGEAKDAVRSVLSVDLERFAAAFGGAGGSPRFGELAARAAVRSSGAPKSPPIHELVRDVPKDRWPQILIEHLHGLAHRFLGTAPSSQIDPRRPLTELGFDSLMAVDLRTALEGQVGRPLPVTFAFEHPTIAKMAEYIAGEIADEVEGSERDPSAPNATRAPSPPSALSPSADPADGGGQDEAMLIAELEKLRY